MDTSAIVVCLAGVVVLLVLLSLRKAPPAPVIIDDGAKYPRGPLQVCFGSQTGTAETFSRTLCAEAKRHGYNGSILDLEDFDGTLEAPILVFAMATYGEGEPTDNAHVFINWAKAQDGRPLEGKKFAVFGLGNTQYEQYNAMGKLVDRLLEKLGGERVLELGLGDDDKDLEKDFEDWRVQLWAHFGGEMSTEEEVMPLFLEGEEGFDEAARAAVSQQGPASTKFYFTAPKLKVVESRELRDPRDPGSTRHVELEACDYETADNLAVLPENTREDVMMAAKALGFPDPSVRFVLPNGPFPTPCSVFTALTRYCDLTAKPKHRQVAALGDIDVEQFHTLASALPHLLKDCTLDRATLLSVFLDKVAPRLQPRYYTISSSSQMDKTRVHVTCSVITLFDDKEGVCSSYLANLRAGDQCAAFVRPSTFRPPAPGAPIILVGPGTGLAPMRAVLRDIEAGGSWRPSRVTLYFGCKGEFDHLYKDEMDAWVANGTLDSLHVAYSRAQAYKIYVQDLMRRDADAVRRDLIDNHGAVFVCGATAMGASVHTALTDILAHQVGNDKALELLDDMRHNGRYVQELWA